MLPEELDFLADPSDQHIVLIPALVQHALQQVFKLARNTPVKLPARLSLRSRGHLLLVDNPKLLSGMNPVLDQRFGSQTKARVQRNHPRKPSIVYP